MPPIRSESVGFIIRFSSVLPWAVPISCTPRSAMVRAASGLQLGADLIDDDHLRHVVLDRLDHDRVLSGRRRHLHPPGAADRRVRDVAVARDLVADVSTMTTRLRRSSASTRATLAQHRRLADAGPPEQQDALAATRPDPG